MVELRRDALTKEPILRESPDLRSLNRIKIDENTEIFVTDKKLKKYGEEYFRNLIKFKSKKKARGFLLNHKK